MLQPQTGYHNLLHTLHVTHSTRFIKPQTHRSFNTVLKHFSVIITRYRPVSKQHHRHGFDTVLQDLFGMHKDAM